MGLIPSFFTKKKEQSQPDLSPELKNQKTIYILSLYENIWDTIKLFLGNSLEGYNHREFLNIEEYSKALEKKTPDIVLLVYMGIRHAQYIQGVITITSKFKPKPYIVAVDNLINVKDYMNQTYVVDYFCDLMKAKKILKSIIYDLLSKKKLDDNTKALVLEKQDFYNYVQQEGLFENRSQKTADTTKELKYISKELGKSGFFGTDKQRILDAGCGNGRLSIPLAMSKYRVEGVDISEELIKEANKKKEKIKKCNNENPIFKKGNLLNLDFKIREFDGILLMWHVICEFREHRNRLLKEMYRVLKQGGKIILDFPDIFKNKYIKEDGLYTNKVDDFKTYIGLVPYLKDMFKALEDTGFRYIKYKRVNWGIPKFVVCAVKP